MLCHAVTSFSSGLGQVLALKPAEQCLATEFSLIFFAGAFLGNSFPEPLTVSLVISTARIPCRGERCGRLLGPDKPFG